MLQLTHFSNQLAPIYPIHSPQEFFTKTEDRPMVKEVVELIKEHRPVEREFVVSAGECCYAYQCALQTQSTVVHLPCLPSAPLTFHPLLLALVCRWRRGPLAWSGR